MLFLPLFRSLEKHSLLICESREYWEWLAPSLSREMGMGTPSWSPGPEILV